MSNAGKNLFDSSVLKHTTELATLRRKIDFIISQCEEHGVNLSDIERTQEHVNDLLKRFDKVAHEYEQFLAGHRTAEGEREMISFHQTLSSVTKSVTEFIKHMNSLYSKINMNNQPRASQGSKSQRSHLSHASSKLTQTLLQHTAKVEQARAHMKYAQEEAELIKQEAALKASRTMLTCKKELEAAEQSLDAVRKVLDFLDEGGSIFKDSENRNEESRYRTERYVKENFEINTPPPNPAVIPESESFAVNEVTLFG